MEAKILVVDDEPAILETVCYRLAKEGFEVFAAPDGSLALEKAFQEDPDLVVLDIMLPVLDGYEVCRALRARGFYKPVILVSARDEEIDKIIGLEVGADDYMTKPFSPRELVARVRAHLRREKLRETSAKGKTEGTSAQQACHEMALGPLFISLESREVFLNGEPISLSFKEYELLLFLASNAGRVLTRDQIIEKVWGYDFDGDSNIVQVAIKRLRQKLKEDERSDKLIATVRGVGYRFLGKSGA